MNKSNPIVSISCITYNHAPFIRKALDGILMQEPPTVVSADEPWYEILIHDDCSMDGTDDIIREYAEKYPDVIFPLYEAENQYSKGAHIDYYNYNRARGKYIACCEGDDYWTDPHKLQKQVDFMDAHPDYSICFHGCSIFDVRSGKLYKSRDFDQFYSMNMSNAQGVDMSAYDYIYRVIGGQPLTMLFRVSMLDYTWHKQYKYYRDTHEIYHLLKVGKGYWMNFDGGIYFKHNGGVSSGVTTEISCWEEREHILELYLNTRDNLFTNILEDILLWNYLEYKRVSKIQEFHKMMRKYVCKTPIVALHVYVKIIKRELKALFSK